MTRKSFWCMSFRVMSRKSCRAPSRGCSVGTALRRGPSRRMPRRRPPNCSTWQSNDSAGPRPATPGRAGWNGKSSRPAPMRTCWCSAGTATAAGSVRTRWARPAGSSSIMRRARCCWSGRNRRRDSVRSPHHHRIRPVGRAGSTHRRHPVRPRHLRQAPGPLPADPARNLLSHTRMRGVGITNRHRTLRIGQMAPDNRRAIACAETASWAIGTMDAAVMAGTNLRWSSTTTASW